MVGDCRDALQGLHDASVDSIVTDPPYGLQFMGKDWDHGVPGADVWAECLRVLKPGGWLLAFAGTRTQHRMATAIEDAGFEIRDMIGWAYGSGFPKSLDVAKAIDSAAGMQGEVVPSGDPVKRMIPVADQNATGSWIKENGRTYQPGEYVPGTAEASAWQGWGTALKPAWEPITVARKPLVGTVAKNVLTYSTGALNIDGCRVAIDENLNGGAYAKDGGRGVSQSLRQGSGMNQPGKTVGSEFIQPQGRWPANLIHDGSDEVLACFPDTNGSGPPRVLNRSAGNRRGDWGMNAQKDDAAPLRDAGRGSAARFFYCAKASKADRDDGLDDVEPQAFVQWQTGNGASGKPSSLSEGRETAHRNTHPTVKPTELMRYLVRLVTPPGGVVLDPFMGSGSTGRGAMLEGFCFIGIDMSSDYAAIARKRIASAGRAATAERDRKTENARQPDLFAGAAE
jgi:site-specific DNA-methyltransferase (adenine-specific)